MYRLQRFAHWSTAKIADPCVDRLLDALCWWDDFWYWHLKPFITLLFWVILILTWLGIFGWAVVEAINYVLP